MPRPNVDIPKYIIGGVEDYAQEHDLSKDDVYAAMLLRGLHLVGQPGFTSIEAELENLEGDDSDATSDSKDTTDTPDTTD